MAQQTAKPMTSPTTPARGLSLVEDLLAFLDACPTPYHAVAECARRLEAAGYTALVERDAWRFEEGARHYVVRAGSSITAFRVGSKPPAEGGFRVVGAHTDSPGLRLKPRPGTEGAGHLKLEVEIYGSPILATWVDRDLALCGRIVVATSKGPVTRLVRQEGHACRLSTVAIHLDRTVNEEGLRLDKHRHLAPSVGLLAPGLDAPTAAMKTIAALAECDPDDVRGFDLMFADLQKAALIGAHEELVASARLDNLASCHASLAALFDSKTSAATAAVMLFDHEEVGSHTAEGAGGSWARDLFSRICEAVPGEGGLARAAARSLLVSSDMAHAQHPNQPERHDGIHAPRMNAGPVVKTNANRRYATDAETAAYFREMCRAEKVPFQEFTARADAGCGSTIGPLVAAALGVRTVDVGNPMLSMHSAREVSGAKDPVYMTKVLTRFLGASDPIPR